MKVLGQPVALLSAIALIWLLALAHPMTFLRARHAALGGAEPDRAAAKYVEVFGDASAVHEATEGEATIGYVSETPIDVRVGGPLQARYYLAQFALAPLLLELETPGETPRHRFVLANFEQARELDAYLAANAREVVVRVNSSVALTRKRGLP